MSDLYLYDDVPVLRNKLGIKEGATLDLIEAEQSRANMMILYQNGFDDFSSAGLRTLINIEKREKLLAGRSVWYSNDEDISRDLDSAFKELHAQDWAHFSRKEFVSVLSRCFSHIWQVHPFREGNTRTVVMMLTFFVEHHGYYMDQELLAACAGYVRDSFVMASLDQFSEFEHLEKILMDAVCEEPVLYDEASLAEDDDADSKREHYKKYQTEKYIPEPHYKREN